MGRSSPGGWAPATVLVKSELTVSIILTCNWSLIILSYSSNISGLDLSLRKSSSSDSHTDKWFGISGWSNFHGKLIEWWSLLKEILGGNRLYSCRMFSRRGENSKGFNIPHSRLTNSSFFSSNLGLAGIPPITTQAWLMALISRELIGPDRSHVSLLSTATGPSLDFTTSQVTKFQ